MSLILKAEFNGEIRRVGLSKDDDATVEKLEAKLRTLFPQLGESFLMVCSSGDFHTDADVARAFAEAACKKPPLVRISVDPNQTRKCPVAAEVEYVQIPSPAEVEPSFGDWTSISQSISLGHKCRLCNAGLEGAHYKCLNCLDVEICAQCEEAQLHDTTHLFVKMRCHVDSLPLKRQIIFKSHIDNPSERELAKEEKKKLREKKIEIDNRKKEAREAERKKRAQEKLKRMQALKEKANAKKVKLTTAEKKKKAAISKVKRAKKVVAAARVEEVSVEPVVDVAEPVALQTKPVVELNQEQQEFSLLRFLSEFHILKELPQQQQEEKEEQPEEEQKVEIELQVLHDDKEQTEEAREEQSETVQEVAVPQAVVPQQEKEQTQFAKNLKVLEEMGFTDRERNVELLVRNLGNLDQTINQLLNPQPLAALSRWLPFSIGF